MDPGKRECQSATGTGETIKWLSCQSDHQRLPTNPEHRDLYRIRHPVVQDQHSVFLRERRMKGMSHPVWLALRNARNGSMHIANEKPKRQAATPNEHARNDLPVPVAPKIKILRAYQSVALTNSRIKRRSNPRSGEKSRSSIAVSIGNSANFKRRLMRLA